MVNRNLSYKVYQEIKNRILKLELQPGAPLIENSIAEQLSVSRTPVREALIKLSRENLVTLISGKGAFVSSVSLQDLEELFTVREALEGIATNVATLKVSDSIIEFLQEEFKREEIRWENGNGETLDNIHQIILDFSGNNMIQKILKDMKGSIDRFHNFALKIKNRDKLSFQEHKEIFEALKKRQPELAEKRMRYHIISTKNSLVSNWVINGIKEYSKI